MVHKLGRNMRDFFLNLDNLHDYLKFTFPRMKAPSFFVEAETENSENFPPGSISDVYCFVL